MRFYVLQSMKRLTSKRRSKNGFMLLVLERVGQRYAEEDTGYWAPHSLFEARQLGWYRTVEAAQRAVKKLPPEDDATAATSITFTGSMSGPGYWSVDEKNGPLFTVVRELLDQLPDPVAASDGQTFTLKGSLK